MHTRTPASNFLSIRKDDVKLWEDQMAAIGACGCEANKDKEDDETKKAEVGSSSDEYLSKEVSEWEEKMK